MFDGVLLQQLLDDFNETIQLMWNSFTPEREIEKKSKNELIITLEKNMYDNRMSDLNERIHREDKKRKRKKRDPSKGKYSVDRTPLVYSVFPNVSHVSGETVFSTLFLHSCVDGDFN